MKARFLAGAWGLGAWAAPVLAAADERAAEESINLFSGSLGQAFWTLLIFLLVVFVLGKFAWGPLLRALQRREEFIRDSLASAKRDREDAEARLNEIQARLGKAREEASAIVEEGRRAAEVTGQRVLEEARQAARAEQQRAVREIRIARDSALKDLYDQSSQLALDIAGAVLKRELSVSDHEDLVKDAMRQLQARQSGSN